MVFSPLADRREDTAEKTQTSKRRIGDLWWNGVVQEGVSVSAAIYSAPTKSVAYVFFGTRINAAILIKHQKPSSWVRRIIPIMTISHTKLSSTLVPSFEPVWRPNFVEQIAPGDNCHLNGLAVRDGQVRYVTALGETDSPGGWRENKRDGGLLIDIESNEMIARGLSMPHSPRWYRDQFWLLESGEVTFGRVDLDTGKYESMAEFPGFTRGLVFWVRWLLSGCRKCASRLSLVASRW